MATERELLELISKYMKLKPESREEVKKMMREHERSKDFVPLLALLEGYEEYKCNH